MTKNKIFDSNDAKTIARTTEEVRILGEAISEMDKTLNTATGTYKEQLEGQKAALEVQKALNKAREKEALNRFNVKNGTRMTADEIASNVDKNERNKEITDNYAKNIKKGGDAINSIIKGVVTIATKDLQEEIEKFSYSFDILLADIEAYGKISLKTADLQAKAYTSAINSSLSNLTKGINEGAYAAASSLIDISAQSKIFDLEKEQINLLNKNTKNLREEQKKARLSNLKAETIEAEVNLASGAVRIAGNAMNGASFMGASAGNMPGAVADSAAAIADSVAAANTAITRTFNEGHVKQTEYDKRTSEEQLAAVNAVKEKWIQAGADVSKAWLSFAQHVEEGLTKSESSANDIGISLGYFGKQLETFKTSMFDTQIVISKWGKTMEDMQKTQNAYSENTDRNIQFSINDFDTSFALDKLVGEDGISTKLTAGMQIFNHSVSDSNEMFGEMYKNVSKIGLNGRKYLKDLQKNLQLAEKYQFKGGLRSLMEMAKWAQNMRFNMNSIDGMLDKVQTGGLEGVIEQSARLQVLGGGYAMGSDPLAIAYESYTDPEGFAKRMNSMVANEGVFNSKTGEVEFSIPSLIRMRAAAEASGQDYKDMQNQARRLAIGDRVSRNLHGGYNWSEDEKSLVTNKAQFVNGEWKVTMNNNEQKSVTDLTPEDLKNLMPNDNEERLVQYVYDIRDMVTKLAGTKQEAEANLERDTLLTWYEEEEKRIKEVVEEFHGNYEKYLTNVNASMELATTAQGNMIELMNQGNKDIDKSTKELSSECENITTSLSNINTAFEESYTNLNNINQYMAKLPEYWGSIMGYGEDKVKELLGVSKNSSDSVENSKAFKNLPKRKEGEESYGEIYAKIKNNIDNMNYANTDDGFISQNGSITKINSEDQVLAAKDNGPIDKLLTMASNPLTAANNPYVNPYVNGEPSGNVVNRPLTMVSNPLTAANNPYVNPYVNGEPSGNVVNRPLTMASNPLTAANNPYVNPYVNGEPSGNVVNRPLTMASNPLTAANNPYVNPYVNGEPSGNVVGRLEKHTYVNVSPRPMPYNSQVMESPYHKVSSPDSGNGKIEIAPIQVNINGNIQLIGGNGSSDLTQQVASDPNFIRSLSHMISVEVEKKVQGGKVTDPVNRNLRY